MPAPQRRRLMRSARGAGTIARVTDGQSARVSEAIVVWSGHGITRWPQPDETRLVERFGEERALTLLHAVTRLYDEFYEPMLTSRHPTSFDGQPCVREVPRTSSRTLRRCDRSTDLVLHLRLEVATPRCRSGATGPC